MVSRRPDHVTVSRFLLYCLMYELSNAKVDEKRKTTEIVINLLYSLDRSSMSCKSLFGILQRTSSLKLSKCYKSRWESKKGSQINQAISDNLRFLKSFLNSGGQASMPPLKRVGSLMDLYIAQVAADSILKPSKFVAIVQPCLMPQGILMMPFTKLATCILRHGIYLAHAKLSEEEEMEICCAINYGKLLLESCKHLVQNPKFSSRVKMS